jgi:ADP-glucose pyrophosphorylase
LLTKYKFAFDWFKDTVYILVENAEDVEKLTGRCFRVGDEVITFFRVLKMEERSKIFDFYQHADVDEIWPLKV